MLTAFSDVNDNDSKPVIPISTMPIPPGVNGMRLNIALAKFTKIAIPTLISIFSAYPTKYSLVNSHVQIQIVKAKLEGIFLKLSNTPR